MPHEIVGLRHAKAWCRHGRPVLPPEQSIHFEMIDQERTGSHDQPADGTSRQGGTPSALSQPPHRGDGPPVAMKPVMIPAYQAPHEFASLGRSG